MWEIVSDDKQLTVATAWYFLKPFLVYICTFINLKKNYIQQFGLYAVINQSVRTKYLINM